MSNKLLIIGAGQYGMVAREAAESMGCFEKIDFLDDNNPAAIGKTDDYKKLINEYKYAVVAMGNSELRLELLKKLEDAGFEIPVLIHSRAYVSPSAKIGVGTIIEPMAVVHTEVQIGKGCLISAGAILNHNSVIGDGTHINCGSVVNARTVVDKCTRTECGVVLK